MNSTTSKILLVPHMVGLLAVVQKLILGIDEHEKPCFCDSREDCQVNAIRPVMHFVRSLSSAVDKTKFNLEVP